MEYETFTRMNEIKKAFLDIKDDLTDLVYDQNVNTTCINLKYVNMVFKIITDITYANFTVGSLIEQFEEIRKCLDFSKISKTKSKYYGQLCTSIESLHRILTTEMVNSYE